MLVADLGYEETEAGKYLVKKEDGLINLASEPTVMTNAATVITLDADLDMSTKEAWVPVTLLFIVPVLFIVFQYLQERFMPERQLPKLEEKDQ